MSVSTASKSVWRSVAFGSMFLEPARNGVSIASGDRADGVQMVNMGELFDFPRIPDVPMARVPLSAIEMERSLLQPLDLLFARRSLKWEGAGRCAVVLEAAEPRTFESSIIRVRLDQAKADPRFYFYWFSSEVGRLRIGTIVEQVAVAGVRGSDLSRLLVPAPDIDLQRGIADRLWQIDTRISSNQKLSSQVQKYLRALFARLTFESARSGSWVTISDVVDSVVERNGKREPELPYIGLEHMPQFDMLLDNWGKAADSKTANRSFAAGDILFGRIRPYLGKVGLAITDGICAQSIEVLRPQEPHLKALALLLLTSAEVINYADAVSTGTTMPQAPWDAVSKFEVLLPPQDACDRFNRVAAPLIDRMSAAMTESRLLTALRDRLGCRFFTAASQPHPRPTVEPRL